MSRKNCACTYIYDAGLPHPPSPPHPMVSPLACQVGKCLVWPCCFPRLVLFGSPVGGSVFYRGMVWLLPLVSSNVIVTCLVPSPPCGVGPVVVLVGPALPVWSSVFYSEIWYGCFRLLAVMSSLRARYHANMMLLVSPCQLCPCPCSDAVLRSCEEALARIILYRPPSLWFAWVRSGCAGPLGAGGGGGWGPGTREHI